MICEAKHQDLFLIAHCHLKAFPDALTSRLGKHYVVKMLSWYLSSQKTFLFFLEEKGICIGYFGGMISDETQVHGSASSMIQYSFYNAIKALIIRPWLWFHPELVSRYKLILKNIYFKLVNYSAPIGTRLKISIVPHIGLVVIGVDPDFQGRGFGKILLNEFEKLSRAKGISRLLLSVRNDNHYAIKTYKRNGWITLETSGQNFVMEKLTSRT